jgi:alkylation response protein AidB-like acyl-CoA dehydrogenase
MTMEVVCSGMPVTVLHAERHHVPYLRDLTRGQRKRWIAAFTRGEGVSALGSPNRRRLGQCSIKTTARRDGDHLVINGQKTSSLACTCDCHRAGAQR